MNHCRITLSISFSVRYTHPPIFMMICKYDFSMNIYYTTLFYCTLGHESEYEATVVGFEAQELDKHYLPGQHHDDSGQWSNHRVCVCGHQDIHDRCCRGECHSSRRIRCVQRRILHPSLSHDIIIRATYWYYRSQSIHGGCGMHIYIIIVTPSFIICIVSSGLSHTCRSHRSRLWRSSLHTCSLKASWRATASSWPWYMWSDWSRRPEGASVYASITGDPCKPLLDWNWWLYVL